MTQISWSTFFEIVAVLLAVYYAVIFYIFYRKNIHSSLLLKFQAATFYRKTEIPKNSVAFKQTDLMDQLFEAIKTTLITLSNEHAATQVILLHLQQLLAEKKFQQIYTSSFKDIINDLIKQASENICSIHLSEEDLRVLWI